MRSSYFCSTISEHISNYLLILKRFALVLTLRVIPITSVHHLAIVMIIMLTTTTAGTVSSIIIIGALIEISSPGFFLTALAAFGVLITSINIFGGFAVTQRMLQMFRK